MFKKLQSLVMGFALVLGTAVFVGAVSMPSVQEIWNNNGAYIGPFGQHLIVTPSGSTLPVTSACGTNTITGTDSAMTVVISGGTPATCAITFGVAWNAAPACWYNDQTTASANGGKVLATTTLVTVTLPGFTGVASNFGTDTINIFCIGKS